MKRVFSKKTLGILVSLIFIGFIVFNIDLQESIKSFGLMDPSFVILTAPVYLLAFVLRALRWKIYLAKDDLKLDSLIGSIFIGFGLNCVLPARAGELYRAYFFAKKEKLDTTKVFTSVILERIFDGVTLFLILTAATCLVYQKPVFYQIALTAGLIFLGAFIVLFALVKFQTTGNKRDKAKNFLLRLSSLKFLSDTAKDTIKKMVKKFFLILNSFIEGLDSLNSWWSLVKSIFYSFAVWLMEGAFTLLIIKSFGIEITLVGALLVLSVTAFSTLIPAGPGGIGPYQWGYMLALSMFNVEPELAFAASVTNQLTVFALVILAGLLYVWKDQLNMNEIKQKIEEKQELA